MTAAIGFHPGIYVTGTDTGIGKTRCSAALLHALRRRGLRAVGMKPVASGCERIDDVWKNADALEIQFDAEDLERLDAAFPPPETAQPLDMI